MPVRRLGLNSTVTRHTESFTFFCRFIQCQNVCVGVIGPFDKPGHLKIILKCLQFKLLSKYQILGPVILRLNCGSLFSDYEIVRVTGFDEAIYYLCRRFQLIY